MSDTTPSLRRTIDSGEDLQSVVRTMKSWPHRASGNTRKLADYARHSDTYFGVYQRQSKGLRTIMDIYDFFAEGHENTPKDKLIALLPNYPDQEELKRFSQKELVEIVAERYTYGAIASGFKPKTLAEIRAERRGRGRLDPRKSSRHRKPAIHKLIEPQLAVSERCF